MFVLMEFLYIQQALFFVDIHGSVFSSKAHVSMLNVNVYISTGSKIGVISVQASPGTSFGADGLRAVLSPL